MRRSQSGAGHPSVRWELYISSLFVWTASGEAREITGQPFLLRNPPSMSVLGSHSNTLHRHASACGRLRVSHDLGTATAANLNVDVVAEAEAASKSTVPAERLWRFVKAARLRRQLKYPSWQPCAILKGFCGNCPQGRKLNS